MPFPIQKQMAHLKGLLSNVIATQSSFKSCLNHVIDDDETMALMSLTLLAAKPEFYRSQHVSDLPKNNNNNNMNSTTSFHRLSSKNHFNHNQSHLCAELYNSHDDIEAILESTLMDCNSQLIHVESIRSEIQHTEEMVNANLFVNNYLSLYSKIIYLIFCCIGCNAARFLIK